MAHIDEFWSDLEKLGEKSVRQKLALGEFGEPGQTGRRPAAEEWLASLDEARSESRHAEMTREASRSATAAEAAALAASEQALTAQKALTTARVAAVIAAAALIVSVIALYLQK